MPHPLPVLLAATIAARAECPEPVDPTRLEERLAAAEVRYAALEGERFAAEMDETALLVPCLDGLVPPELAARYHRLQGLRLYASRSEERARQAFAAARAAAPEIELPEALVPPGHALRELWAIALPDGPTAAIAPPASGGVVFDGRPGERRPEAHPALVQLVDAGGAVLASAWLEPSDPMIPYEPVRWWGARGAPPRPAQRSDPAVGRANTTRPTERWGDRGAPPRPGNTALLVGGGAAAVVGGALYGIAAARAAAFEGPKPPDYGVDDLRAYRRATNTLVVGSGVAGGLAVATVGVALIAGRW